MGGDGIYRKTEKGRTEIATRANKLGMRERTLLIMVDDKTTRSDLLSRSAHPASGDILDSLLAQGFIETDMGTMPAGAGITPVASVVPAAAGTIRPAAAAGQAAVEVSLVSASRFACRALVTYLGPGADDLTALVEKTKGAAELATILEKCRQIIQGMAGRQKAEEFWAGVSARLPKA
ncbi:MAG: hypothetical protein NTV11_08895 [Rhodocyclales bacterium]|nr:hypothetical protein [Rhodocyclales bacterium]